MKAHWFLTIMMLLILPFMIHSVWNDVEGLKAVSIFLATFSIAAMCKANNNRDKLDANVGEGVANE
jgi:hypothetical protein